MSEKDTDYKQQRILIGSENKESFVGVEQDFRPKMRIVLDTQIWQITGNERVNRRSLGSDNAWGIETFEARTVSAGFPDSQINQLPYLYSIFQLCRDNALEIYDTPIGKAERYQAQEKHSIFHGQERLDFEVLREDYPLTCPRMQYYSEKIVKKLETQDPCEIDVGRYDQLRRHLTGIKQRGDVAHFIQADIAGFDCFICLDKKFISPFRQIEPQLRQNGVRLRVQTPKEFCENSGVKPIPVPPPDPRQTMGTSPPDR